MLCSNNPNRQPSLVMSPVWFPLIDKELHKLMRPSLMISTHVWGSVESS